MVFVVLAEVISNHERGGHVHETRADAVHEAVRQEQPLGLVNKRRPDAADTQHASTEQPSDTVAMVTVERTNESN